MNHENKSVNSKKVNAVTIFKFFCFIFAISMLLPALRPNEAQAIPAFARAYNAECSTCHTIFPQRNEFGDAFLKNGYVWPGTDPLKADVTKEKVGGVKWPAGIPKEIPISLLGEYSIKYDDNAEDKTNMKNYEGELLAGGTFGDTISFFLIDVLGGSDGGEDVPNEVEEAFVMYRHALGSPLNIKAGKFMPQTSIWKENNKIIGATPAVIDFAVDEANGETPLTEPQYGIELNSVIGNRLFTAAGVLDPKDRNVHADDETNSEGVKGRKDYYGHISYKIGGADFLGNDPASGNSKSILDDISITVGAFGYQGNTLDPLDNSIHDFNRAGLEAGLLYKKLNIMMSGVRGTNHFSSDSDNSSLKSKAFSAEADYQIAHNLMTVLRYDYVHIDHTETTDHVIPAVVYAPLQNFKVSLEVDIAHAKDEATGDKTNNTTGTLNLAYSF